MQRKSILIVEDNRELVSVLAVRCRRLGFRVRVADEVVPALAALDDELPDLACINVNLPGGGLRICELLAADPRGVQVPVIVLTGRKDDETIRRCGGLCAYYLHKSGRLWERLEPVIYELLDIDSPTMTFNLKQSSL